jgi:serine/threonine protein kinase
MALQQTVEAWLASCTDWENGPGEGWKGVRIIGNGTSAIGLFEYDGTGDNSPSLKQIVIKQIPDDPFERDPQLNLFPRSTKDEGEIQYKLAHADSRHIVRSYARSRSAEYGGQPVWRIFTEYCAGGDLDRLLRYTMEDGTEWIGDIMKYNARLDEIDVWAIFHCIALGILVMEYGTENPSAAALPFLRDGTEITHLDLTPDNCKLVLRLYPEPFLTLALSLHGISSGRP